MVRPVFAYVYGRKVDRAIPRLQDWTPAPDDPRASLLVSRVGQVVERADHHAAGGQSRWFIGVPARDLR